MILFQSCHLVPNYCLLGVAMVVVDSYPEVSCEERQLQPVVFDHNHSYLRASSFIISTCVVFDTIAPLSLTEVVNGWLTIARVGSWLALLCRPGTSESVQTLARFISPLNKRTPHHDANHIGNSSGNQQLSLSCIPCPSSSSTFYLLFYATKQRSISRA